MPVSEVVKLTARDARRLRSRAWWDNPGNPGMTAQYLERFLNYGLTRGGGIHCHAQLAKIAARGT